MFWLSYECFSILYDAFLLKSAISSHTGIGGHDDRLTKLSTPVVTNHATQPTVQ